MEGSPRSRRSYGLYGERRKKREKREKEKGRKGNGVSEEPKENPEDKQEEYERGNVAKVHAKSKPTTGVGGEGKKAPRVLLTNFSIRLARFPIAFLSFFSRCPARAHSLDVYSIP